MFEKSIATKRFARVTVMGNGTLIVIVVIVSLIVIIVCAGFCAYASHKGAELREYTMTVNYLKEADHVKIEFFGEDDDGDRRAVFVLGSRVWSIPEDSLHNIIHTFLLKRFQVLIQICEKCDLPRDINRQIMDKLFSLFLPQDTCLLEAKK